MIQKHVCGLIEVVTKGSLTLCRFSSLLLIFVASLFPVTLVFRVGEDPFLQLQAVRTDVLQASVCHLLAILALIKGLTCLSAWLDRGIMAGLTPTLPDPG